VFAITIISDIAAAMTAIAAGMNLHKIFVVGDIDLPDDSWDGGARV
jgi:hypothetical protein